MRILLVVITLALPPLQAQAPEVRTTAKDRTALSVTIYQNGLAAIRDTRRVALPAGPSRLAFADLVPSLRPKSATLLDPGNGIQVRERNFEFNLLSPASLVDASLGMAVKIKGEQGRPDATGTLTSVPLNLPPWRTRMKQPDRMARNPQVPHQAADPEVLVSTREGQRPVLPDQLAFQQLPPDLRASPTLLQDLTAPHSGSWDLTLAYTATGFDWVPNYVATVSPDGRHLDLDVFASVTNQSLSSLDGCALQLMAGWVEWMDDPAETQGLSDKTQVVEVLAAAMAGPPAFEEEKLFEYPLFTLDRPISLRPHAEKQLLLFQAQQVPLTQHLLVECPYGDYDQMSPSGYLDALASDAAMDWPERHFPPVQRIGTFQNTAQSRLGRALPSGLLTVRYQDPGGALVILPRREDRTWEFPQTPTGEEVTFSLGPARGLRAHRLLTHRKIVSARPTKDASNRTKPHRRWEYTIEVRLINHLREAAVVTLREPIGSDWELRSAVVPGRRSGASALDFDLSVPAQGQATLRYSVLTAAEPIPGSD